MFWSNIFNKLFSFFFAKNQGGSTRSTGQSGQQIQQTISQSASAATPATTVTTDDFKKLIERFNKTEKDSQLALKKAKSALKANKDTYNIAILGFVVLLVVVVGIVLAYIEFTQTNRVYYEENLKNQNNFTDLNNDFKIMKYCLKDGWKNNCFK